MLSSNSCDLDPLRLPARSEIAHWTQITEAVREGK